MLSFCILLHITFCNTHSLEIRTFYKVKDWSQRNRMAIMDKIGGNY